MSLIHWGTQYQLGIESIDQQHKTLVDLINNLNAAMAEGSADQVIADILQGLKDYTQYHFDYEERLFKQYGYQDCAAHIEKHRKMIDRVDQFALDFQHDTSGAISLELLQFMTNWLLTHIQKSDIEYVEFLQSKGVV